MKAQELRIGNYYLQDCLGGDISHITAEDILELYDDPLEDYFKPIQLTEDWLLKFGFDRRTEASDKWYVDYRVAYSLFGAIQCGDEFILPWDDIYYIFCIATTNDGMESYETLTKIKYVHQLQNLYFALTGEELTIKQQ